MFLIESRMFAVGWVVSSCELITSIGDAELVTVRSLRRVPVMTISSPVTLVAGAAAATPGWGAAWTACGAKKAVNAVAEDSSVNRDCRLRLFVMESPENERACCAGVRVCPTPGRSQSTAVGV